VKQRGDLELVQVEFVLPDALDVKISALAHQEVVMRKRKLHIIWMPELMRGCGIELLWPCNMVQKGVN